MVLIVNGIRQGVEWRNLVCFPANYETAFDLLSNFVATGLTLLEASVSDGESFLKLPVESFDGQGFSLPIKNLQKEWEAILSKKPSRADHRDTHLFLEWDRKLILYYEKQIERVCKNMVFNRKTLMSAAKKSQIQPRIDQVNHYESMHKKYTLILNQFQASHQKAILHLEHLSER